MKLLICGATGGTGREIASQSLERGHQLTLFVRDPAKAPALGAHLVTGDVLGDTASLIEAVRGQDAVVSSLGRGLNLRSRGLMARAMATIVPTMANVGVRRFVLVSAFGVGETRRDASLAQRLIFATLLRGLYADKRASEDIVRASPLDWTILYPVRLTDGPRSPSYRVAERLTMRGTPTISRADTAHCALALLEDPGSVRRGFVISA